MNKKNTIFAFDLIIFFMFIEKMFAYNEYRN